jgi:predicted GTPase
MADVIVINKVDSATPEALVLVRADISAFNPGAVIVEAASPITVEHPKTIDGKRVLVVEDGPTLTHGEMAYSAGYVAAIRYGGQVVDPRPYAVGSIAETYEKFRTTGPVLPAMGYSFRQVQELEQTIARTPCDVVLVATPIDLRRVLRINKPSQRVKYALRETGHPTLFEIVGAKFGPCRKPPDREVANSIFQ